MHYASDQMTETVPELNMHLIWRKVPWSVTTILTFWLYRFFKILQPLLKTALIWNVSDNSARFTIFSVQKSMVLWCLWWLNGIPGNICRWRFISTGAKRQRKGLGTRLQGNDTGKLLSKALRSLLLPENSWFSLEFVSRPRVQVIKLFVAVLEIILTAIPAYILSGKKLKSMSWRDMTNGKIKCTAV